MNVALRNLVLDDDLYPRQAVDAQHVRALAEALESGATLPPIIVDEATLRIVDGWHRYEALTRLYGEDAEIEVEARGYTSEADLYADAIRLNASHGRRFSNADHSLIMIRARDLGISTERVGSLVGVPASTLERRFLAATGPVERVKTENGVVKRRPLVPLKRTLKHLDGQTLTAPQVQANAKAGGMAQSFYSRQLVMLARADALDLGDQSFVSSLIELRDHLDALDLESYLPEEVEG